MRHAINQFSFEWLVNPDAEDYAIHATDSNVERGDYPIPADIGTGGYESWVLSNGMALFRGSNTFNPSAIGQTFPMAEVTMAFHEPTFQVQSIIKGQCIHNEISFNKTVVYAPGNDLFRYTDSFKVIPILNCSEDVEMISLMVGVSVLSQLLGESMAIRLLKLLELTPAPALQIRQIPLFVSNPLHHALASGYQTPFKAVLAQAKALEYLGSLSHYLDHETTKSGYRHNRSLAKKLYDHLLSTDGHIPTLIELASAFGRSAQSLNNEFEAEYGVSIYAFIHDRRMQQAREAIIHSDLALKQIAARLGYSHVNNFIAAFRAKFGYTPGSLRKG